VTKHLIGILLLAACASTPPPAPAWTSVPRSVLDGFCSEIRAEGLAGEGPVAVVRTSRPLVTASTVAALAEISFHPVADTTSIAQQINASMTPLPVEIPAGNCTWQAVDAGRVARDTMAVELSAPFVNPFARNEAGSLARMSVGGEGATWYWIRLVRHNDQWIFSGVSPLGPRG
jgi:hypothetical protein